MARTSKRVASKAARILGNPGSSRTQKSVAGAALRERRRNTRRTGR